VTTAVPVVVPSSRVLVVGAGIAGLAAASALRTSGIDVLVLEARSRIGGRCFTAQLGNVPFDLGASWIHQPDGNPVRDLIDRLGLGRRSYPIGEIVAGMRLVSAGGQSLAEPERQAVLQAVLQLDDAVAESGCASPARSVASVLEAADLPDLPAPLAAWARYVTRTIDEVDLAAPATDIASANYAVQGISSGGDDLIEGGYVGLAEHLAAGLPIRLGTAIRAVRLLPDRVELACADGRVEAGSHALITVPLGVLQAGAIHFEPPLPEAKRRAIGRLGFGRFEKVVLRFESAFWEGADRPGSWCIEDEPLFPFWIDFTAALGVPVVTAHVSGPPAWRLAEVPAEQRLGRALSAFGRAVGRVPPPPLASLISHWGEDPWTLGAYTRLTPASDPDDPARLAEPVGGRLRFAGEATSSSRFGYVDGAYASGLREAARLVQPSPPGSADEASALP